MRPAWKEGGAPPKMEQRGLSTADHKLRAAKADRPSILPPDPEKLGERQPPKLAHAGGANAVYGAGRWSKVTTVLRNGVPTWHQDPGETARAMVVVVAAGVVVMMMMVVVVVMMMMMIVVMRGVW